MREGIPDWETSIPVRAFLRCVFSTSSGYLRRRARRTAKPPARAVIPATASAGSTSGASGVDLQSGLVDEQGSGLAKAAELAQRASTEANIVYFRIFLMFVILLGILGRLSGRETRG